MKKKFNLKEKIRQFIEWREQPREVAPMSQEEHECLNCLNCHDHYVGSYCPRCGQAASTDRFSMKVAAENFAVVLFLSFIVLGVLGVGLFVKYHG